jgi:predicted DCC family thiol-disulfide oxidoreductase YuxK
MTELIFLNSFLVVGFVLAPLMTKEFFLRDSRVYSDAHKISLLILLMGAALNLSYLAVVWPLFCAFGFFLYLKKSYRFIFSIEGFARCIPFVFSLISSVWFASGVMDLHLLGYDRTWSFYAALHGAFLGWMFVGCLAFLSGRTQSGKVYLWGCYLCLVFFLLVAFGIDGIPYVKRIGVVGFSVMVPVLIGRYAINLKNGNKLSFFWAALSFFSIVGSMSLAILNEFWPVIPRIVFGIPVMVLVHGLLNAVFAVPCFFLAIRVERDPSSSGSSFKDNIIFFDGFCVLCSGTVARLIKIDEKKRLKYSSLQGRYAQEILEIPRIEANASAIFFSEGGLYEKAEAVIRILIKLGGIYKLGGIALSILPLFMLDRFYEFIARNRYRLFGKRDSCLSPTEENKNRFVP